MILLYTFGCGNKHKSVESDPLAQYRDTLIGNFNGLEIDTLICEPMDSTTADYKGFHFKWRVFSKNRSVKDLILDNKTIGIHFVNEGDLDGNGTNEWDMLQNGLHLIGCAITLLQTSTESGNIS